MKKVPLAAGLLVFLSLAKEALANPLDYTIRYRDPRISITEERKQGVINQVLRNWPESKIESRWDYVYSRAVENDWNPAFVIALWLEESAASGVSAYDLGCLGGEPNNIPSQLSCLFRRPYANEPFRTFMCKYSGEKESCYSDSNYNFVNNPHFPTNLGIWYYRLTGDEKLSEVGKGGEPDQPSAMLPQETIRLKDSLASNNLPLDYSRFHQDNYPTPPPPSPSSKIKGTKIETGTKLFEGELKITEEGKNLPDFQILEKTLFFSLEKLLPEALRKEFAVDSSQNIIAKTRHFIYGYKLDENDQKIPIRSEEGNNQQIPEEEATFPSWWSQLIGESKIICGLFNTCAAPKGVSIKIAAVEEYDPPEGLGQRDSTTDKVEEKNIDNNVIDPTFTILSFFKRITEDIIKFLEGIGDFLAGKKETVETFVLAESRAIVPGGENIRENTSFFKNFLPAAAVPAFHDAPLKVNADYEVSENYTIAGEEKLEYQNLGAARRNYCLSLCSQYPAGFDISKIDPLCSSCNPENENYRLDGYGDMPLSQALCQWQEGVGCHYYDPLAKQGCGEDQDPVCEGGRCNPYEFYTDDYVKACGASPWYGQCRNPDICYKMTFAPNEAGGFGECQYANPTVCVRADRLKVGKCAAVCNWICCEQQEK